MTKQRHSSNSSHIYRMLNIRNLTYATTMLLLYSCAQETGTQLHSPYEQIICSNTGPIQVQIDGVNHKIGELITSNGKHRRFSLVNETNLASTHHHLSVIEKNQPELASYVNFGDSDDMIQAIATREISSSDIDTFHRLATQNAEYRKYFSDLLVEKMYLGTTKNAHSDISAFEFHIQKNLPIRHQTAREVLYQTSEYSLYNMIHVISFGNFRQAIAKRMAKLSGEPNEIYLVGIRLDDFIFNLDAKNWLIYGNEDFIKGRDQFIRYLKENATLFRPESYNSVLSEATQTDIFGNFKKLDEQFFMKFLQTYK